jgi:hypothetical protein
MSHDMSEIIELSLGIGSVFVATKAWLTAIKSAGTEKKGTGARQNDGKPAIKDSLIVIKESLIMRCRSGETAGLGRLRC